MESAVSDRGYSRLDYSPVAEVVDLGRPCHCCKELASGVLMIYPVLLQQNYDSRFSKLN
jgi:hypothetical protein